MKFARPVATIRARMNTAPKTAMTAHSSQAGKYAPAIVSEGAPSQPVQESACPNSNPAKTSPFRPVIMGPRCTGLQSVKNYVGDFVFTANRPNKLTRDSTVCNSGGDDFSRFKALCGSCLSSTSGKGPVRRWLPAPRVFSVREVYRNGARGLAKVGPKALGYRRRERHKKRTPHPET